MQSILNPLFYSSTPLLLYSTLSIPSTKDGVDPSIPPSPFCFPPTSTVADSSVACGVWQWFDAKEKAVSLVRVMCLQTLASARTR